MLKLNNILLLVIVVVCSLCVCFSSLGKIENKKEDFTIRGVKFGMTKTEVKKIEESEPSHETDEAIFYDDTVMGIEMHVIHQFYKGKLFNCGYVSKEDYSNDNKYVEDYINLCEQLEEKYGDRDEGYTGEPEWNKDLYRDDPSEIGFAVSIGHVEFESRWTRIYNNRKIVILATLDGDDYEISTVLSFLDDEMHEKQYEDEKKKESDKF